jgi:predicted signal transduction protein with EAL and GGDEF domain
MILTAFVTIAALTLSATPPATKAALPVRPAVHRRRSLEERQLPHADDLYSLRARRRFAAYLRMRLLELREAGLERAANVIEKRLPVESLLAP